MANEKNSYEPDYVPPPGATLRELLDQRCMSQIELADRIGQTRKNINEILQGEAPITPETALKLERALGIPSRFWNNREQQYRDFIARKAEQERLKKYGQWLRKFPTKGMVKLGWIEDTKGNGERTGLLFDFFGVASAEAWEEHYGKVQAMYRQSKSLKPDRYALAAWLRQGELVASAVPCRPFDAAEFRQALGNIRKLTLEPPYGFQQELVALCSACGVAVAFVPELPKTVSGATRWLTPSKALLQLSLRYRTDDHLWFTFFHEAGHILLHQKKSVFLENDEPYCAEEEEANRFSANFLLSAGEYRIFVRRGDFSKEAIRQFANDQGVAPGIVVGRLQHDRELPFSHCNDLKRKLMWSHA